MNTEQKEKEAVDKAMRDCLIAVSEGRVKCDMDYPNFRVIKSEVIAIDLTNVFWKPIRVKILEKGLKKEVDVLEDRPGFGFTAEPSQVLVKKQKPFKDVWIDARCLSNFK